MIVQLVQSILDVPEYVNEGMAELANLFRSGQDSAEILPLLCSNCDEVIYRGAWIATEINQPLPTMLNDKLSELLHHSSSKVRTQALLALKSGAANESMVCQIDRTKNPKIRNIYRSINGAFLSANNHNAKAALIDQAR